MFDLIGDAKVYWELKEVCDNYHTSLKLPDEQYGTFFSSGILHAYRLHQAKPIPKLYSEQLILMAQYKLFHEKSSAEENVSDKEAIDNVVRELISWCNSLCQCVTKFGESLVFEKNEEESPEDTTDGNTAEKKLQSRSLEKLCNKYYPVPTSYNNLYVLVYEAYLRGKLDENNFLTSTILAPEKQQDWYQRYQKLYQYVNKGENTCSKQRAEITDALMIMGLFYEMIKTQLSESPSSDESPDKLFVPFSQYKLKNGAISIATQSRWKELIRDYTSFVNYKTVKVKTPGLHGISLLHINWKYLDDMKPAKNNTNDIAFICDSNYQIGFQSFYGFKLEHMRTAVNRSSDNKPLIDLFKSKHTFFPQYSIDPELNEKMIQDRLTEVYKQMYNKSNPASKREGISEYTFKSRNYGKFEITCQKDNISAYIARLYTGIQCLCEHYNVNDSTNNENKYVFWEPAKYLNISPEKLEEEKRFKKTLDSIADSEV